MGTPWDMKHRGKCLVDSGIFGVPTELVAKTMCEAVTKFCQSHQSRLRVIHLVDINTAMVKLLQENFEQQSSTSEENSQKSALPSSGDPGGDHKQGCHICRTVYDMLQGNQPKSGTMHSTICSTALPGYSCRTIVIEYSFPDGTQTVSEHCSCDSHIYDAKLSEVTFGTQLISYFFMTYKVY